MATNPNNLELLAQLLAGPIRAPQFTPLQGTGQTPIRLIDLPEAAPFDGGGFDPNILNMLLGAIKPSTAITPATGGGGFGQGPGGIGGVGGTAPARSIKALFQGGF